MRARSRAPADVIEKVAQWLIEAEQPLFVVGSQVGIEGAAAGDRSRWPRKLSVPVAETMHSLRGISRTTIRCLSASCRRRGYPRRQDLADQFRRELYRGP